MLTQNLAMTLAPNQGASDGVATSFNIGSTPTTQTVSLSGIGPGLFHIHATAEAEGMLDWDVIVNLNLEKRNTPPILMVYTVDDDLYATWSADGYSFTLSGNAFDPDGTVVELSATMCDETTTSFTSEGSEWVVSLSIAKCVSMGLTESYDVIISAKDDVGEFTTMDIFVPNPDAEDETEAETDTTEAEEEAAGLPSVGLFASLISILAAAIILRKDN
tara:strand:- start:122 stop:775 length:654 start_codon:yes stop_codon:yes gene_type:complete